MFLSLFVPDLDSWDVRIDSPPGKTAQWVKFFPFWETNLRA